MRHRIMRAATRPTNKGPASNFGGTVLHEEVFAPEAPSRLRASRVTFAPGGAPTGTRMQWDRSYTCSPASAATRCWASRCTSCCPATRW